MPNLTEHHSAPNDVSCCSLPIIGCTSSCEVHQSNSASLLMLADLALLDFGVLFCPRSVGLALSRYSAALKSGVPFVLLPHSPGGGGWGGIGSTDTFAVKPLAAPEVLSRPCHNIGRTEGRSGHLHLFANRFQAPKLQMSFHPLTPHFFPRTSFLFAGSIFYFFPLTLLV